MITNIAMLHDMVHEAGHPEPWIIALSAAPSTWRAHDYGLRWGIEAQGDRAKMCVTRIGMPESVDRL